VGPSILVKGKAKRVLAMAFWIEPLRSTSQTIWTKISAKQKLTKQKLRHQENQEGDFMG
jgi:hypothetical protein